MTGEAEEPSRRSLCPGLMEEEDRGSSRTVGAPSIKGGGCESSDRVKHIVICSVFSSSSRCGAEQHPNIIIYGAAAEGIPSMGFHRRQQHQGRSLTK